jgi:hypothetical protein
MKKTIAIFFVAMLGASLMTSGCIGGRANGYDDDDYRYGGYYDSYGVWHYYNQDSGYYYNNHQWYSHGSKTPISKSSLVKKVSDTSINSKVKTDSGKVMTSSIKSSTDVKGPVNVKSTTSVKTNTGFKSSTYRTKR